ncbi:MAG TPA: nucleotide sugar dehydrogenase [Stellaceae bacterium]|nr:nucleotide sugar dehydrogenase [Stellaceae bacterium]
MSVASVKAAAATGPRIGYAGMTHLGLISGVAAAARGFATVCFDPDRQRIAALKRGELPVVEPGLPELLAAHRDRLDFTAEPAALAACDVVYVAPDVPTDDKGSSDLGPLEALLATVGMAVRPDAVLVILSQVPPGFTRRRLHERVPAEGEQRLLYYQVETLVFGRAVERALKPERFIVGCADPAKPLPAAYADFLAVFACPILPMRFESAELAKISINLCLVASVSVANTLAELCERIGADWGEIAPALRLDPRIGADAYLSPGLGLAGGNLERDLATILNCSRETGTDAAIVAAFLHSSRHRRDWALRTLHSEVLAERPKATIGILGLAYKENTHSTKNSPSLALIRHLQPWRLRLFDPVVPAAAAAHPAAAAAASPLDAAEGADALVIMTPWPQFRALDPKDIARRMAGPTVIDPYRVLSGPAVSAAGLDWLTLGMPALRRRKSSHA